MRRIDSFARRLWGAAGFRLVLLYAVVFAASSGVLFLVVQWATIGALRSQIEAAVAADLSALRYEQRNEGTSGLAAVLRARTADRTHPGRYYALFDAGGHRLAGDLVTSPAPGTAAITVPGPDGADMPLVSTTATLADGAWLAVAHDATPLHEVNELLLHAFLWAGGLTVLFGIAGGIVVARGFLGRIDAIASAAEAIAAGELSRRVPTAASSGWGDEMERLGRAINAMLERIQHLMEELRHATSAIAHDLRTPLARLRQQLEAARHGARGIADYDAAVEAAIAETDAILKTFAALLRIAQIESGSRRAGFADLDLAALTASVAEAYGPSIEESGRALTTRLDSALHVHGDRELLIQAVANLLENALHHTGAGTRIALSVTRTGMGAAAKVRLRVADDGPGVPETERQRILGRFHRLDPSRSDGGSGLGLALVAAVAELHEAVLTLEAAQPDGRGLAVGLALRPAGAGDPASARRAKST